MNKQGERERQRERTRRREEEGDGVKGVKEWERGEKYSERSIDE